MHNLRIKPALYLLLILSFALYYVIYRLIGFTSFDFKSISNILPKVISCDLIIIGLFSSLFWKITLFRNWLVPFPNLNGTWKGNINSTWEDPLTGSRPDPIPAILTINQSFFKISCVMRTAEMVSYTLLADFLIDDKNQIKKLLYTYDSYPIQTVKERSPQSQGTMNFDIIEKTSTRLIGEYWTDRKTTGHIEMEYWKKDKIDYYPEEIGKHPVSELRKKN